MKYDISDMWVDILQMLNNIHNGKDAFTIHWPSNSFFVQWDFIIAKETLFIEAYWMTVSGGNQSLLNLRKTKRKIEVYINVFIKQWESLLLLIKDDMIKVGYYLKGFEKCKVLVEDMINKYF
jgi:hypothetical protein